MRRMLRAELNRNIVSWRFVFCVFGIVIFMMGSQYNAIIQAMRRLDPYGFDSSMNLLDFNMKIDRCKIICVILLTAIATGNLSKDCTSKSLRYILIRGDLNSYVWVKLMANTIAIILASFMGILLFVVLLLPFMPYVGNTGIMLGDAYGEMVEAFPPIYILICGLSLGTVASICTGVGILFSAIRPNQYIAYGVPILLFYFLYRLVPLPDYINIYKMCSAVPTMQGSQVLSLAYLILFSCTVIGIIGLILNPIMEGKVRNGMV